jgi:hypothetical protein
MINDYGLTKIEDLVGKVIPMSDKSGRVAQTRITKVAPFTKEYQDATWQKEGWEKSVTDKLVGQYPYAIEFELVQPTQSSEAMTTPSGKIRLNDGNSYSASDINSVMLEAMGYKPKEIGTILKSIC